MSKKVKTTKKEEKKNHIKMENLTVNQLRQRLFTKQSEILYGKTKYSFVDDVPEQIEVLEGFKTWESFSKTWDVLWVGLDPRTLQWVPGRHNSPMRKVVSPICLVWLDDRTKRMQVPSEYRQVIGKMEVPFKEPIPETEEDRVISEALSGRVIVDESDGDKAIRLIQRNMEMLQEQLAMLTKNKQ